MKEDLLKFVQEFYDKRVLDEKINQTTLALIQGAKHLEDLSIPLVFCSSIHISKILVQRLELLNLINPTKHI